MWGYFSVMILDVELLNCSYSTDGNMLEWFCGYLRNIIQNVTAHSNRKVSIEFWNVFCNLMLCQAKVQIPFPFFWPEEELSREHN